MIPDRTTDRPDDTSSGHVAAVPIHMLVVRRHGDEYQPLKWRAYCHGCHGWRIAPDGSRQSWERIMTEVIFHLITGMWE